MISSVTCVNGSFTVEGEGWSESQVGWEEAPNLLGTHNTTGCAQLLEEVATMGETVFTTYKTHFH